MLLQDKITVDLKNAMKSGSEVRVRTLRMLASVIHNKEIENKSRGKDPILKDEEVIDVLAREAKKRKEAIDMYQKGERNDLADKEREELEIINAYLPEKLSDGEIEKIISEAIKNLDAGGAGDFGRVMGVVMKELKGRAEGSVVLEIIKKKLNSLSKDK